MWIKNKGHFSALEAYSAATINKQIDNMALVAIVINFNSQTINMIYRKPF